MSRALSAVAERLVVGTRLECLENTYIPSRAGAILTITRQGKRVFDGELGGKTYRMELKPRLRMLDANTFTHPVGRVNGIEHSVTWRILGRATPTRR
jgi:hypothetical protein